MKSILVDDKGGETKIQAGDTILFQQDREACTVQCYRPGQSSSLCIISVESKDKFADKKNLIGRFEAFMVLVDFISALTGLSYQEVSKHSDPKNKEWRILYRFFNE